MMRPMRYFIRVIPNDCTSYSLIVLSLLKYYRWIFFDNTIVEYSTESFEKETTYFFDRVISVVISKLIETYRIVFWRKYTSSDYPLQNIRILTFYGSPIVFLEHVRKFHTRIECTLSLTCTEAIREHFDNNVIKIEVNVKIRIVHEHMSTCVITKFFVSHWKCQWHMVASGHVIVSDVKLTFFCVIHFEKLLMLYFMVFVKSSQLTKNIYAKWILYKIHS